MIKRSQSGDMDARNILIEKNMRLVAHMIKKYMSPDRDTDDLISVGTIGLIKAVNTFDPDKKIRLATYAAKCIDNELLMMLRNDRKKLMELSLSEPIGTDKEGNDITFMDVVGDEERDDAANMLTAQQLRCIKEHAFSTLRLEQSADKKMNLLGWADNITAPELFVCDENLNRLQQLTHTNLRPSGFIFRKSELIRYKNSQGKELKGALFYPVNYREGQSYPMIVHIYERLSQHLNDFVFPSASDLYNTMNYVLQGYFVFQPDITYEVNRPGESAVDCVTAAVRQVLKREDIDPARLGLIGHSWGAYQTAYIITQTPLFAAAVAGAPLTDMISMYNSIYWESGRSNQEMFETGQARFRLPWWQISRQYICNSPVFQAENIQTPLLMIFGTEDQAVDWSQGLEMYITMRRLGKPCILLTYEGEGHTIGGQMNTLDQTGRVMDYFDYYLKKTVAADWILEGRTYLKKKGEE